MDFASLTVNSLIGKTTMNATAEPVKLKRGTAAKIARKLDLSVTHVSLVIKGERVGSAKLTREIERECLKQRASADRVVISRFGNRVEVYDPAA